MYGYVVTHHEYGVLAYSPPYPFLRQIGISSNPILGGGITVSAPIGESDNSPHMEYQVAYRSTLASESVVGDPARISTINARVETAALRRENLANAKKYGQRWFANGSRNDAMHFIREELKRAKYRVIIADPYLAGLQLWQFLYAVNPEKTTLTLLTSGLAFKPIKQVSKGFWQSIIKKMGFKSKRKLQSKVDYFDHWLNKLKNDVNVTAQVYVLQSSILHDRFLVVDDHVWFLGNSLNTLGDKASLILKLPNPDEVITKLEDMLKQAISFETYKNRQTKR
jgi:hypothetical protein